MALKEKIVNYVDETKVELRKVSWPTWDEVRGSTIVVIITTIIMSMFTFVVDSGLSAVTRMVLSR